MVSASSDQTNFGLWTGRRFDEKGFQSWGFQSCISRVQYPFRSARMCVACPETDPKGPSTQQSYTYPKPVL